tara:strand:+ start:373 stop:732 length:360 start_codon:yes stop_codon:yes gene_type:complete
MNNSNPFDKKYFSQAVKPYIKILKSTFKKTEFAYSKMYNEDGEQNEKYSDDTMCKYYDLERFLEFVEDKESFYSCGSVFVDIVKIDSRVERFTREIESLKKRIIAENQQKEILIEEQLK